MFDCDLCSRAFQSRDLLFAHFEKDHREKVQNDPEDHGLYMVLEWNVPYLQGIPSQTGKSNLALRERKNGKGVLLNDSG